MVIINDYYRWCQVLYGTNPLTTERGTCRHDAVFQRSWPGWGARMYQSWCQHMFQPETFDRVCVWYISYIYMLPPKDLPFLLVECIRWQMTEQLTHVFYADAADAAKQWAALFYLPVVADCILNLSNYVLHILRQQLPSACPQISVAMPVLILRRPNVSTKQRASHLGELIQTQAFLDELPSPINDLGSCLDTIFFPWKFVGSKFHKNRRLPDIFAFDLDTFLLMNYTVVQNTWHFGLVRTCTICMEDHLSIFESSCSFAICLSLSDESEEFSMGASSSDELEDESESEDESDDESGLPSSRASGTSLASGCWSQMGNFMFLTTIGLARRDANCICARSRFHSPSAPPLRSSMRCTLFIALLSFFLSIGWRLGWTWILPASMPSIKASDFGR